jgi:hypothetical protein
MHRYLAQVVGDERSEFCVAPREVRFNDVAALGPQRLLRTVELIGGHVDEDRLVGRYSRVEHTSEITELVASALAKVRRDGGRF